MFLENLWIFKFDFFLMYDLLLGLADSSASETQEAESKNVSTDFRGSVNVENNNPANE